MGSGDAGRVAGERRSCWRGTAARAAFVLAAAALIVAVLGSGSALTEPPDTTNPTIDLATPRSGAIYPQTKQVTADYTCADEEGGSGIATCTGTVSSGAAVDTSTLGAHSVTVTATDHAGNTASLTHDYTVRAAYAPSAYGRSASSVTATSATVSAGAETDNVPAYYAFQVVTGTPTSACDNAPTTGSTLTSQTVDADLTGLTPATAYHYRIVVGNLAGTSCGPWTDFTTLAGDVTTAPSATTGAVSAVATTGATLHGTVNPNGATT